MTPGDEENLKEYGPFAMEISVKNILEEMAKSSEGERKKILDKIIDTADKINIDELNLLLNNDGLQINKENFIKHIENALNNPDLGEVSEKLIKNILTAVNREAVSQAVKDINKDPLDKPKDINKGPLDKLGDAFKELSTKEKIVAGVVAAVASPLIVLAVLIVLVVIGVRYAVKEDGMAIGAGQMETVEQKVDEQVDEMNPSAQVGATKTEQVDQRTVENPVKQ